MEGTDYLHLLTAAETARMLGLNTATIYRLARRGQLRTHRILGRAVRFDISDVMRFAAQRVTRDMPEQARSLVMEAWPPSGAPEDPGTTPRKPGA